MNLGTSLFKVYGDDDELMGTASVTLPTVTYLSNTISGAGIAGNIEAVIPGMLDAMSLTLNFKDNTEKSFELQTPNRHTIELRADKMEEDQISGQINHYLEKHTFIVVPKSRNFGTIAPASNSDGSGEYTIRYWRTSINGKVTQELDPINRKVVINGVDYAETVRKNLGD